MAALLFVLVSSVASAEDIPDFSAALAREILPANDGWAAAGATWGRRLPSGAQENARNAARTRQQNRIRGNLTSTTTLEHDKAMLLGGSDSATADRNKLRVTLHHNVFDSNVQRAPRVRFGKVHIDNNYYAAGAAYSYSWGVGVESQIYAEDNYFETGGLVHPSRFISRFNANLVYAGGTLVDGHAKKNRVDVVAEYNLARNPDLSTAVTWTLSLVGKSHPAQALPGVVLHGAGPLE